MRNFFFLTSRNRRRAARVRVSRCLGAEIRQAGRHVRASGGKRRGGLKKLLPEIRKLARHPVHSSRSNVRVSLNVEKKNSKKRGKKERNEDGDKKGRGKKKKSFLRVIRSTKRFFPFRSHETRAHVPGIHAYFPRCEQKNDAVSMCAVEVCVTIYEREMKRKGSSITEREREREKIVWPKF